MLHSLLFMTGECYVTKAALNNKEILVVVVEYSYTMDETTIFCDLYIDCIDNNPKLVRVRPEIVETFLSANYPSYVVGSRVWLDADDEYPTIVNSF